MWFKVLGLLIAIALLGKAAVALAAPGRFYAVRQRQYASASVAIICAKTFGYSLRHWGAL